MFALPVVSGIKQALIILFVFNNKKKKITSLYGSN